ncbi:MAG: hydrogenase maturation nickel metallochaperone HypA [Nocardioides sp.]
MALTLDVVDVVATRTAGRRVSCVRLDVGELTGVVPEALRFCFDLATQGTGLDGARLDIRVVPGRITCRDCGATTACADRILLCGCGSADVAVVHGEELLVASVEVVKEEACA